MSRLFAALALAGCITVQIPASPVCSLAPPPALPSFLVYTADEAATDGCEAPFAACFLPADFDALTDYTLTTRSWMWRAYLECGGAPLNEPPPAPIEDAATEGVASR